MSLERRPHRPGGFFRSVRRHSENQEGARRAEEELRDFQKGVGEPSAAFYPLNTGNDETVIYLADKIKERKAKRRRERESVATPRDLANRHRKQLERYIELEHYAGHPAKVPPEWRRLGVKYWDEIQALKGNSITISSAEASLSF